MECKSLLISTFASLLIAGCVAGPTSQQLAEADYGRDMTPEECVSIAENVIANSLKDPSSAQFRHSECRKDFMWAVPIAGVKVAFGWLQVGEVNAKNSYGGYVGFRRYNALIRDGAVVRYCVVDSDGNCFPVGR